VAGKLFVGEDVMKLVILSGYGAAAMLIIFVVLVQLLPAPFHSSILCWVAFIQNR
jgi:hypothetical protein